MDMIHWLLCTFQNGLQDFWCKFNFHQFFWLFKWVKFVKAWPTMINGLLITKFYCITKGLLFPDTGGVTNLPHYKNSRPENLSGSEEKFGVFFAQTIFAFPSGFIFRMIRPLNFEELGCLVAGFAFRLIKNAARMFLISQVLLKLNRIMLQFSNRVLEAASELRHVEYIVDLREVRRQFQSVCHWSTSRKDTERANVARS